LSSTEWISVNDEVVERGDWSGPGGARAVLRHPDVDVAILETARGGLLRRGLGVRHATVALITNIAEDHLGDFGSQNLEELLDIKWIVSRVVEKDGTLILNADDPLLVRRAENFDGRIDWFSLRNDHPLVASHTAAGGRAFILDGDELVKIDDGQRLVICRGSDIPIALDGAARHNIANALSAAALTSRMGASPEQVRSGLTSMAPDRNPGRCNLYDVQGFKVLVDFAHNPHAMQALFNVAKSVPAKRRALCFGQAGDRTDAQIRNLARCAWEIGLELVVISELSVYARGRVHGEVHAILRDELKKCGAEADQILHFENESESLDSALQWARPGDLVIMLALGGSVPVHAAD
jgi:UDP-N-acetylmuramyl tripeptide synthase